MLVSQGKSDIGDNDAIELLLRGLLAVERSRGSGPKGLRGGRSEDATACSITTFALDALFETFLERRGFLQAVETDCAMAAGITSDCRSLMLAAASRASTSLADSRMVSALADFVVSLCMPVDRP